MRWIIDPAVQEGGSAGIDWCRRYLEQFDTSDVEWLRIDRGRERPGQRVPTGLYGRCWYPSGRGEKRRGFRISCQVPGPWPHTIHLRLPPVYAELTRYWGPRPSHVLDEDGSQVFEMGTDGGRQFWDVADQPPPAVGCVGRGSRGLSFAPDGRQASGAAWWKMLGGIVVYDLDEAVVWIVGHEAFHFLRRTRQVPGRNVEHEADAAGSAALAAFRAGGLPA